MRRQVQDQLLSPYRREFGDSAAQAFLRAVLLQTAPPDILADACRLEAGLDDHTVGLEILAAIGRAMGGC